MDGSFTFLNPPSCLQQILFVFLYNSVTKKYYFLQFDYKNLFNRHPVNTHNNYVLYTIRPSQSVTGVRINTHFVLRPQA